MKNKLIPITILPTALLMGKSDDYKTLDYKYKVKKYDALRVYFDCSIGNLTMRPSNNRYIIIGNIDATAFQLIAGDLNIDGTIDVLDVVQLTSSVLGNPPPGFNEALADMNQDGGINILDIVLIIGEIIS